MKVCIEPDEHGDLWLAISNGEKLFHERDLSTAWLDRVLRITAATKRSFRPNPNREHSIDVKVNDGNPLWLPLPRTRVDMLVSLYRRYVSPPPLASTVFSGEAASNLIICDDKKKVFLLSRKDHLHPNPLCRGRLCLLGGCHDEGETLNDTVIREIYEEVTRVEFADFLASEARPLGQRELPQVQWNGDYLSASFVAEIRKPLFDACSNLWRDPTILSEGIPVMLNRIELEEAVQAESEAPGSTFVSSHHEILRSFLKGDLNSASRPTSESTDKP